RKNLILVTDRSSALRQIVKVPSTFSKVAKRTKLYNVETASKSPIGNNGGLQLKKMEYLRREKVNCSEDS
nr:hypothetical protein [Tanacetum cinerariifolium]